MIQASQYQCTVVAQRKSSVQGHVLGRLAYRREAAGGLRAIVDQDGLEVVIPI